MNPLTRYVFGFNLADYEWGKHGALPRYVGVTAFDHKDAVDLISRWLFRSDTWPQIEKIWENFDLDMTEELWAKPGLGNPAGRGLWMPPLNHIYGIDDGRNPPFRPEARSSIDSDFEGVIWYRRNSISSTEQKQRG